MSKIQFLFLILLWAMPILLFINTYMKLDKEEQLEFISELKSPSFLLIGGFSCIGALLFFSGNIATLKSLQHIGAFMVTISWFSSCIASWTVSAKKSVALMSMGVLGIVGYLFLVA